VVAFLVEEITGLAERQQLTPYEAMWAYAETPVPAAHEAIPVLV
jgi:hypothetical protein